MPKLQDKLYYDYQQKLNEIRAFGICFENNIESDCNGKTKTILNVILILEHNSSHSYEIDISYSLNENYNYETSQRYIYNDFSARKTDVQLFK